MMKEFIKKNYFLIAPLFITLLMLLQKISFYQIDDRLMMEMAHSFQTNSHSEHIMFININFGYVLKFLYHIAPTVNWFAIMYIVVVNIAFVPLYRISQNYPNQLVFAGMIAVLQISVFVFLTFTFLSFICATTAILWSLEHVKHLHKKNIKHLFFSFLLLCLGFGMRSGNTFLCVLMVFLPLYFFAVTEKRNSPLVIAILFITTITANYGMVAFQKEYKKSIPEATYFNQFQEYRAVVSDDLSLNYEKNKEIFDSVGITENDIHLYKNWKYADKNVFSNKNLGEIVKTQTFWDKYTLNVLEFPFNSRVILVILIYIFLATGWILLFPNRRKEIFVFSLFVLGAILFLHIRRRAPFRVVFPITILGITALLYIAMQEVKNGFRMKSLYKKMMYLLIGLLIVGFSGYNILNISNIEKTELAAQRVSEYIASNENKIYLTDETGEWDFIPKILSFQLTEEDAIRPYNIFGDWYLYSYFWYDRLEHLNLLEYQDCAFKALLEDNVRMVYGKNTDTLDRICLFLKEHYGIRSRYQTEDTIEGTQYSVYRFEEIKD